MIAGAAYCKTSTFQYHRARSGLRDSIVDAGGTLAGATVICSDDDMTNARANIRRASQRRGDAMFRVLAAVAAFAVGATAVWAQNAAGVAVRKETMKTLGSAWKGPADMAKGERPFDLAVVQASLKTFQDHAPKAKNLFPDDTKTGDTAALPAAFENKADVFARFDKLAADAKAAAAAIKDEASFKAEWPKVVQNCGGCHQTYRKKAT